MASFCIRCRKRYELEPGDSCPREGEPLYAAVDRYAGEAEALVGRVLDGRYLIEAALGGGGMGVVLAGRHLFLERQVAIKILHPELLVVDTVKDRFLREARAASALRHPHVVEVSDFGVTEEGLHYLVMERLEGGDLHDRLAAGGPMEPAEVARLGAQVADALSALHQAGFVHRDLKPDNIWLSEDQGELVARVLDFGIVGLLEPGEGGGAQRLTRRGTTLGTPNYMAPEQAQGRPVDGRADLYALGAVLWEALVGEPMITGSSPLAVMSQQLTAPPRAPSTERAGVPAALDAAILRSLAKDPADRFATAQEMREALLEAATAAAQTPSTSHEVATSPTPIPMPVPTVGELELPPRRQTWLALSVVLLVAGGAAVYALSFGSAPDSGAAGPEPIQRVVVEDQPEEPPKPASEAPDAKASAPEVPPPAPEEQPETAARQVVLNLNVLPEGTRVSAGGEALGKTPLALVVDAGERVVEYTFEAPGHRPLTLPVSHAEPRVIEARLVAERAPAEDARAATPKPGPKPKPSPKPTPKLTPKPVEAAQPTEPAPTPKPTPKPSELLQPER